MKYFLVNGKRITEEEFKKMQPPEVVDIPMPTLPPNPTYFSDTEWTNEKRKDGIERVKTGKKRKKAYNFIGNKKMSKHPHIANLQRPPPLNDWDYSLLKSHTNTWTPRKVVGLKREELTKLAYYFKLYDEPNCYGASKEYLYNRLMELSFKRKKNA
jgi:hypothetical protein